MRFKQLGTDPRYAINQNRVLNRAQLYAVLYDYIRQFNFKELYAACIKQDVPIGKIRDLREVFELPEAKALLRNFRYNKEQVTVAKSTAIQFL